MSTFTDGSYWIVDGVEDVKGIGRRLHYVFADGRSLWFNIGQQPDNERVREEIASMLWRRDRRIRGIGIPPPFVPPGS